LVNTFAASDLPFCFREKLSEKPPIPAPLNDKPLAFDYLAKHAKVVLIVKGGQEEGAATPTGDENGEHGNTLVDRQAQIAG
jgi:hypothetical protein